MSDTTLVLDWPPMPGDLLLLRIERQLLLAQPGPGWELMARWPLRREQLWSRVALAGEGGTITVGRLRGLATLSVLRRGKLHRVATNA